MGFFDKKAFKNSCIIIEVLLKNHYIDIKKQYQLRIKMKKNILFLAYFTVIYTLPLFTTNTFLIEKELKLLTKEELEEICFNQCQQEIINNFLTIIFNNKTIPIDNETTKKYLLCKEITKNFTHKKIIETQTKLEFNPSDIVAFCKWATEEYPNNEYSLFLWNHGLKF
jgi:hypothetical protein